jgi:hypothetical protein
MGSRGWPSDWRGGFILATSLLSGVLRRSCELAAQVVAREAPVLAKVTPRASMLYALTVRFSEWPVAASGREPSLADIVPFTISSSEPVNVLEP